MNPVKAIAAALPLLILGCATYSEGGVFGGFNETPLARDTYRIQAYGNGFTSRKKTNAIALVRAADLAIKHGYDRFIILDYDEWSKSSFVTTPTTATTNTSFYGSAYSSGIGSYSRTNVYGSGYSNTTINHGQTFEIEKPRTDVVVKFIRNDSREAGAALLAKAIFEKYGRVAGIDPVEIQTTVASISTEAPNGNQTTDVTYTAQPKTISPPPNTESRPATSPRKERSIEDIYASLSPEEKLHVDSMTIEARTAYLYSKRYD